MLTTCQIKVNHTPIYITVTLLYTLLILSIVNHVYTNSLLNNFLLVYILPSLTHSNITIHVNARLYLQRLQPMRRDYSDFILLAYTIIPKA